MFGCSGFGRVRRAVVVVWVVGWFLAVGVVLGGRGGFEWS